MTFDLFMLTSSFQHLQKSPRTFKAFCNSFSEFDNKTIYHLQIKGNLLLYLQLQWD